MGLLGYSFVQQSSIDRFHREETFNKIGDLLSKTTIVDQFNDENEKYSQTSFNDYELGRLIGIGCNAAVYEAKLRAPSSLTSSYFMIPSEEQTSESDIEILSRQLLNNSLSYEDIHENYDNDEGDWTSDLTVNEGHYFI